MELWGMVEVSKEVIEGDKSYKPGATLARAASEKMGLAQGKWLVIF